MGEESQNTNLVEAEGDKEYNVRSISTSNVELTQGSIVEEADTEELEEFCKYANTHCNSKLLSFQDFACRSC